MHLIKYLSITPVLRILNNPIPDVWHSVSLCQSLKESFCFPYLFLICKARALLLAQRSLETSPNFMPPTYAQLSIKCLFYYFFPKISDRTNTNAIDTIIIQFPLPDFFSFFIFITSSSVVEMIFLTFFLECSRKK